MCGERRGEIGLDEASMLHPQPVVENSMTGEGGKLSQRQIRHTLMRGIEAFCSTPLAGLFDRQLPTYFNITLIMLPKFTGGNLDLKLKKTARELSAPLS